MANKIRVNLYLPSMRPVKEKLPLSLVLNCWLFLSILVGAVGWLQHNTYEELAKELVESTDELNRSKEELTTLETRHADFKPSTQLLTKLDRLSQELNGKRFLSQHLTGKAVPNKQNYAQVMLDMGRLHDDKLWITSMRFEEQEVSIKGYALDALAVPSWLNGLQESEFFAGKSFAMMNLTNKKQDVIAFEINTVAQKNLSTEDKMTAINALSEER
jgi:Tfp pilus assembly protein PilN